MNSTLCFENAAALACGALLSAALAWQVKSKPKYVCLVLLNSLSGGILSFVFSALRMTKAAAFSSFLCGLFGAAGFAVSLFL